MVSQNSSTVKLQLYSLKENLNIQKTEPNWDIAQRNSKNELFSLAFSSAIPASLMTYVNVTNTFVNKSESLDCLGTLYVSNLFFGFQNLFYESEVFVIDISTITSIQLVGPCSISISTREKKKVLVNGNTNSDQPTFGNSEVDQSFIEAKHVFHDFRERNEALYALFEAWSKCLEDEDCDSAQFFSSVFKIIEFKESKQRKSLLSLNLETCPPTKNDFNTKRRSSSLTAFDEFYKPNIDENEKMSKKGKGNRKSINRLSLFTKKPKIINGSSYSVDSIGNDEKNVSDTLAASSLSSLDLSYDDEKEKSVTFAPDIVSLSSQNSGMKFPLTATLSAPVLFKSDDNLVTASIKQDKVGKKFSEFESLFKHFPSHGTSLMNTFVCGHIYKGHPVHGKMYLSDSHIGFAQYRKTTGYLCISLSDVQNITRLSRYGLNVAIRLEMADGTQEDFVSLSRREQMFLQICESWSNFKPENAAACIEACLSTFKKSEKKQGRVDLKKDKNEGSTKEASCNCKEHLEFLLVNDVVNMSVPDLKSKLYGENQEWYANFAETLRSYTNLDLTDWEKSDDASCLNKRTLAYDLPFVSPLGRNTANVNEHQRMLQDDLTAFSVESDNQTPEVPYGKSFTTRMRVCLTSATPNVTRIKVTFSVIFLKSVFGPIKNTIITSAKSGVATHMNCMIEELHKISGGRPQVQASNEGDAASSKPSNSENSSGFVSYLSSTKEFVLELDQDNLMLLVISLALMVLAYFNYLQFSTASQLFAFVTIIQYLQLVLGKVQTLQENLNALKNEQSKAS